jgi:transposase
MLKPTPPKPLSKFDLFVFETFVPQDHYLRKVMACVDFESFRPRLAAYYSANLGRCPIDPVRMLKILFLCFHYHLSDRQVMQRTTTDMAFRWFLGLGRKDEVPNHTNGTHFRERLGDEGFGKIFQEVVTQARAHGLVSDRLRLKDATHLLADVADLRPIALVAQVRETLWQAAEHLFADVVGQQRRDYQTLTQGVTDLPDDERLALRVQHLAGVTATLQQQLQKLPSQELPSTPASAAEDKRRQRLRRALEAAAKLLSDFDHPQQGDRLVSGTDADARRGKHGGFYVGYLLDLAMDPVSEIVTAVNTLPANGGEAADAVTLIRQEQEAQANKVQGLSIDGVGYNGPVLRELTDPEGLHLDVTVPPKAPRQWTIFPAERFPLTVLEDGTAVVTCPAGQTSGRGQANPQKYTTLFRFKAEPCNACSLREQCLEHPESHKGRTVQKNDYQAEYDQVIAKAKTPEYQQTRRLHRKVERKLNEVARHHRCRRARYRRQPKVLVQAFLTTMVVNVKRMVALLVSSGTKVTGALPVRAEPAPI